MMRWKHLLLVILTIIINYSCSTAKISDLTTPQKSNSVKVPTVLPVPQPSQKSVKQNKENILQQLDLSAQQQQQIEQLRHQYQKQIHQRQKDLELLQQQFRQMMAGTDSAELIRAKNQELVKLGQEIRALRFESMLATRELLTPQQRQKFQELVESQAAK